MKALFGYVDKEGAVLHDHFELVDDQIFIGIVHSGFAIELPAVPGAYQHVSLQGSLAEWSSGMGAYSVKAMNFAIRIAQREAPFADLNLDYLTGFHVPGSGNFDQRHI